MTKCRAGFATVAIASNLIISNNDLFLRPVLYVEFNPSHLIVEFFRRNFDGSDMFSLCVELKSSDLIAGAVAAQI